MPTRSCGHVAWLVVLVAVACAACQPAGAARAVPARPGPRAAPADAALERDVLDRVNRYRTAHALAALASDARIADEARRHSAAMASGASRFGHDGFDARVAALHRVVKFKRSAENVASARGTRDPAAEIVRGWLGSRGHRENIEDLYGTTGVGVAWGADGTVYVTQIFVGP